MMSLTKKFITEKLLLVGTYHIISHKTRETCGDRSAQQNGSQNSDLECDHYELSNIYEILVKDFGAVSPFLLADESDI